MRGCISACSIPPTNPSEETNHGAQARHRRRHRPFRLRRLHGRRRRHRRQGLRPTDSMDFSMFGDRPRCETVQAPPPPAATWTGTAATMSACRLAAMPPTRRAATTRCMPAAIRSPGACARPRRQYRTGLRRRALRPRQSGNHPAGTGIQEIRHRRQRQSGAAQSRSGHVESQHRRFRLVSRPTARWSMPKFTSPDRATPIWAR